MTTILTLYGGTGDCWCNAFSSFDSTGADLYIGSFSGDDDAQLWVPFVVPLAKGTQIISATVDLKASATSASTLSQVSCGCENATSPANPTSAADLRSRVMTGASTVTLLQYILNANYSYVITTALQNVLNRSDWVYGSTVAFMLRDVDTVDKPHKAYSANTANPPFMTITVPTYVPRGGFF